MEEIAINVDQLEQVIKSELKEKSDSNSGKDKLYKIIPLTKEDLEGTDGAIHLDGILTKFKNGIAAFIKILPPDKVTTEPELIKELNEIIEVKPRVILLKLMDFRMLGIHIHLHLLIL